MKKKIKHTECIPEELEIKMRKKYIKTSVEINWNESEIKKRKARKKKQQTEYEQRKTRMKTRSIVKILFYEQKNSFMLIDTIKIKMLLSSISK